MCFDKRTNRILNIAGANVSLAIIYKDETDDCVTTHIHVRLAPKISLRVDLLVVQ